MLIIEVQPCWSSPIFATVTNFLWGQNDLTDPTITETWLNLTWSTRNRNVHEGETCRKTAPPAPPSCYGCSSCLSKARAVPSLPERFPAPAAQVAPQPNHSQGTRSPVVGGAVVTRHSSSLLGFAKMSDSHSFGAYWSIIESTRQWPSGLWFQPLWKILVSWDDDIPNIWKVIKFMFQTTNQPLCHPDVQLTSSPSNRHLGRPGVGEADLPLQILRQQRCLIEIRPVLHLVRAKAHLGWVWAFISHVMSKQIGWIQSLIFDNQSK